MEEALAYLRTGLGLVPHARDWDGSQSLPLFLRNSSNFLLVLVNEKTFLLAEPHEETLPSIKRVYKQLACRVDMPIAISCPHVDARQRKTLVIQGIPFICANRQICLPFLGVASSEWGSRAKPIEGATLSFRAQQAAIWGALRDASYTLDELRAATGMNSPRASETVRELAEAGLVSRKKQGRILHLSPVGAERLLSDNMERLSTPVVRTVVVSRSPIVQALPFAGESVLAAKTMLNAPQCEVRAIHRSKATDLKPFETIEGELPGDQVVRVQVWKYGPVYSGCEEIDQISLGLSLAEDADERIMGELNHLFGKEYQWGIVR